MPSVLSNGADRDINRIVRNLLERKRGHVSTFPGRRQYSINGGGTSACGLAALNCVRYILTKEKEGIKGAELLRLMMRKDTLEVSAPEVFLMGPFDLGICATGHLSNMSNLD